MNHIFISYRRDDAIDITGRINDRLREHFGGDAIFTDVFKIPLGVDFRFKLTEIVSNCHILLAVIGKHWITAKDKNEKSRLMNPMDFVRIEIESALQRNIPVIPLLVQSASIPSENDLPEVLKELAFRNGIPIRPDPDFHEDMNRLILSVEQHLQLVENDIWQKAKQINTIESYDDYRRSFPVGKFTNAAFEKIRSLKSNIQSESKSNTFLKYIEPIFTSSNETKTKVNLTKHSERNVRHMVIILMILEIIAVILFVISEANNVRMTIVILPSLVGIALIFLGWIRRSIINVALGICGGIVPWLLVFLVDPMATIFITTATVLPLGYFALKDLSGSTAKLVD